MPHSIQQKQWSCSTPALPPGILTCLLDQICEAGIYSNNVGVLDARQHSHLHGTLQQVTLVLRHIHHLQQEQQEQAQREPKCFTSQA